MAYGSRLGRPLQPITPDLAASQVPHTADQPAALNDEVSDQLAVKIQGARRAGDNRVGRPPAIPQHVEELSPDRQVECHKHFRSKPGKGKAAGASAAKSGFTVGLLVCGFLAAVLSALLLLASIAIAELRLLPLWSQWIAYASILVLFVTVLVPSVQLALIYARLPRVNQFLLDGRRKCLKQPADVASVTKSLWGFLEGYNTSGLAALSSGDGLAATCNRIKEERAVLLETIGRGASDIWIQRFHEEFQQPLLDALAVERVKRYARLAAVQTAISPNALVDALVVIYYSIGMINELCRVYQVRAGRFGTAVLLARLFFTAYVAGRLDDAEDFVSEKLEAFWDDPALQSAVGDALFNVAKQILSKAAAKTATGFASYIMLRRLGAHGIRLLQPTRVE